MINRIDACAPQQIAFGRYKGYEKPKVDKNKPVTRAEVDELILQAKEEVKADIARASYDVGMSSSNSSWKFLTEFAKKLSPENYCRRYSLTD